MRYPGIETSRLYLALNLCTVLLALLVVVELAAAFLTHSPWAGLMLLAFAALAPLVTSGNALSEELKSRTDA